MTRHRQYDSEQVDRARKNFTASFTAGVAKYFLLDGDFQKYKTGQEDTLVGLALQFEITIDEIRGLNESELIIFGDEELLPPGLELKLPLHAKNIPLFEETENSAGEINSELPENKNANQETVVDGNSNADEVNAITGITDNNNPGVDPQNQTTGVTDETLIPQDNENTTQNVNDQVIILPADRSGIFIEKSLTAQQKKDFYWTTLWADFKKEFAGTYPKHTDWILGAWIRKCLVDGWEYVDAIPDIHNEKEVGEKELGKNMIIVISSFSFGDAFAYAWKKYGEGKPFWWYDEKTGKYSYHTVYFGSEGMQYNSSHHTYDVNVIDQLYHVSGDVALKDNAVAEKKIGEDFTKLVLDAQKVLYFDDQAKWTGKLDPDTEKDIQNFLALSESQQDVQRVTAHYLLMIGSNDDLRSRVWQAYNMLPGVKETVQESTGLLMQADMLPLDQVQSTTLGSIGGHNSVDGQFYLKDQGDKQQEEQDRKDRGAELWNQYMAGLQQAFLAANVKTNDEVLESAMQKYSIVMRENGAVQTIHTGGNQNLDISTGEMGTSTFVHKTGKVIPETLTMNYHDNLKEGVLQKVEDIKEEKLQKGIETQLTGVETSQAEISSTFDRANLDYMKRGATLLGGEMEELYNDWIAVQLRLLALTAEEKKNPPDDFRQLVTNLHYKMLGLARASTDTYMSHTTNPYYPDELGDPNAPKLVFPGYTPPAPGSFEEFNNTFTRDTFVLQGMIREHLVKSGDTEKQRLGKEWESSQAMSSALSKNIWGDREHNWIRLPVSFFSEENLHDQLAVIDPAAAAKVESNGVPLQMYWAIDDEGNYVVRVILNPNEDPVTVTGSTLEEALEKLNTQKVLPKGTLYYSHNGETKSIVTEGGMLLSTKLGLASLAFLVAGAILTPFTAGSSMVVATMMVTSATIGVVASGVSMYEHSETGTLTTEVVMLETLNIAANILGGVGSLAKVKSLGALKGLSFAKNVYYVEMSGTVLKGAAVTNIIVFTDSVLKQLQDINENIPEGPERDEAIKRVVEFAVLMGFVMVISSTAGAEENVKNNTTTETVKGNQNAGDIGPVTETPHVETVPNTTVAPTTTEVVNPSSGLKMIITKTGETTVNLDVEVRSPEGGTGIKKVTGELKDGEWSYKMADDSKMPEDVETRVKSSTVGDMSVKVLKNETVAVNAEPTTETTKTGTDVVPAIENQPPADLLSPYPKMREQLPAIQAKLGNTKYYKFEAYLRELPENVKIKLNDEPGLVEPLSKKFLTDPVWANEVKAGSIILLDELRVKIDGKMYKPEGKEFYTDEAGNYYKKNAENDKLELSSKEEFENVKSNTIEQSNIDTEAEKLKNIKLLTEDELKNVQLSGEGRTFNHFTNIDGVSGITGIDVEILKTVEVGNGIMVENLNFGVGTNDFLTSEGVAGEIFVTDLSTDLSPGKLQGIGVWGDKQNWAISFSEESAFLQGARVKPQIASRGIYTIPAKASLKGIFIIKRIR